jgi:hypothetical protein
MRSIIGMICKQSSPGGFMSKNFSTAAVGWAMFAAIMLMIGGFLQIMEGLAAIIKKDYFVVGHNYVYHLSAAGWGWIHLLIGVAIVAAGVGIFSGNVLARTVGVLVAAGGVIANFLWIPYYPVWAIVLIAINVTVIWALTAHGRDIAADL